MEQKEKFSMSSNDFSLYSNHFKAALFEFGFDEESSKKITAKHILPMKQFMIVK